MKPTYTKLFIAFFLAFQISFSQRLPIDFSMGSHVFDGFDGTGFSFRADPDDANNQAGQFFNDGTSPWQGAKIDLTNPVDLDARQILTLSFYSFDPIGHDITLKLENGTNPDVQITQRKLSDGWTHDITFDFSDALLSSDGVTQVNATGTYNRIVIFIDGGTNIVGPFVIDNINDGSVAVDPNTIDIEYTKLVWSDEFDSTTPESIDDSKWHHQTIGPFGGVWANGEQQHYTDRLDNSYNENGFLNIVAKRERYTQDGIGLDFTSARLNSKYAFTYGRVDVRAKLPSGNGTWPAIWTLGKNVSENGAYWQTQGFGTTSWPACGEIDIMEHGLGAVNHTSSAIHTPSSSGNTVNTASQLISDVAANFHIYSVNWSPNQITFLVDGVAYYTYNPAVKDFSTWPFDLEQYLILNVAMGGIAGAIEPSFTQSPMVIDYVRVYQESTFSTDSVDSNKFKVYPNPATSKINIQTNLDIDLLELYDITGKLIIKQSVTTEFIAVDHLSPGLYLLNIYSGNTKTVKKVIIN